MIDGIKVIIGGSEYIIADFNLRAVQKIAPYLKDFHIGDGATEVQMESVAKVITAALQRNYPDINEDWVLDNLNSYEIIEVMAAIGQQFSKKKPTTAAATVTSTLTGAESTPSLSS